MGALEIAHHVNRYAYQKLEAWRVTKGWSPQPPQIISPRITLFSSNSQWEKEWHNHYKLDVEGLCNLEAGRVDFFGHSPLDIGIPVNWHRDPLTGIKAPLIYGKAINYRDEVVVGNIKFLWELGRHQHLVPLAVAYAVAGEPHYREAVSGQIENWIDTNPFGLGIHWCNALELALRLISWALIHSLIALRDGQEGLFGALRDRRSLGKSIYQQAWFIRKFLSRYSSANNHLIGELTGLWVATQVFDLGCSGAEWGYYAQAELEKEASEQVFEDGVDKEQAVYYHLWVLEYLLFASLVGRLGGKPFSDFFESRVHGMADFLRDVAPPGGQPPQIGDADNGFVTRFDARWPRDPYGDVLAAERFISGQTLTHPLPQKAFWYGMMADVELTRYKRTLPVPPAAPYPRVYPKGGYAVLGNGAIHLVFDAGSLGYSSIAAHGHADALSFCLALECEWWIVDPGTYSYHSESEWRNYFRGTSAHNTLMVDGVNQSQIGGSFLWLKHANARLDGIVHAPFKTAQSFDWSAPDEFFTGRERGRIEYIHQNGRFEGVLELTRFKQAGPYVLTVDTADGSTLAGYDCDIWNPWADLYGETFPGGTNGCWEGSPYADVKLFYLEQYDSNHSGIIDAGDYYGGTIPFDVPLLNGTYNLKFFVKLDYRLTSPYANIMMMNNMNGDRRYGKVVKPKRFNYEEDLIIENGLGAEKLALADHAWCVPFGWCTAPSDDLGYQGTTGVVFYSTLAETFQGTVVLSNTVTPPTPQEFQIKLEGLGSQSIYADSNEAVGHIGRWWDNNTNSNISDTQYVSLKNIHDVLGYVIFDGFDPSANASRTFALDSSYHTLWNPELGRPTPGDVVMSDGDYVAYFALTENISWWRGVFLSENPLEFTINH